MNKYPLLIIFVLIPLAIYGLPDKSDLSDRTISDGPRRDDLGDQLERFNLPYLNNSGLAWDGEYILGACRTGQRHLFCIYPVDFDVIEDYSLRPGR